MSLSKINSYNIVLASQSPRRRQLLSELGVEYSLANLQDIDETYPQDIEVEKVPEYLSTHKASYYKNKLTDNDVLITADTIVILKGNIIGKPKDFNEAVEILTQLSGNSHTVITGVCLTSKGKSSTFASKTEVYFKPLSENEIQFYLEKFEPFDKAGAYGIQDWIGYVAIEKIEGSFYNVMGLPTQKLYQELIKFCL